MECYDLFLNVPPKPHGEGGRLLEFVIDSWSNAGIMGVIATTT